MIKGTLFVRFLFFMIEEDRKGAGGNTMKKKIGVPIRVQLFGGFLVSILFIILGRSISYQRAADSLTANYTSSTRIRVAKYRLYIEGTGEQELWQIVHSLTEQEALN